MGISDPDALRAEMLERWERAAAGWGRRAAARARVRDAGVGMDDRARRAAARPAGARARGRAGGHRVPRRRADPSRRRRSSRSDASEEMLEVARARARRAGNRQRRVQAARARVDRPDDRERRRGAVPVGSDVRPSIRRPRCGRCAACCARAAGSRSRCGTSLRRNPWATIPDAGAGRARARHAARSRGARDVRAGAAGARCRSCSRRPGSSTWSSSRSSCRGRLTASTSYIAETDDLSSMFARRVRPLSDEQRAEVIGQRSRELAEPYIRRDGVLRFPARSLVAAADA